jgi:hypothetical protein
MRIAMRSPSPDQHHAAAQDAAPVKLDKLLVQN